ncbi:hypothetical protein V2J09_009146 [Rumex salicifolius]
MQWSQEGYIHDILVRTNMIVTAPISTPVDPQFKPVPEGESMPLLPGLTSPMLLIGCVSLCTLRLLWLKQLLTDLLVPINSPPMLLCDDVGAIFLTKNPIISTRSKHIGLDFCFIREQVVSGALKIGHISSTDQLADIFTTAVQRSCVCSAVQA